MQPSVLTRGSTTESPSGPRQARRSLTGVVLGAALALTLAACSSGATPTTTGASGTRATGDSITIKNFAFSPQTLTVSPGAVVSVTNKDSVTHTLTSETGVFNTGDVAPGSTEHFTAPTTPGTYHYRCNIHQFMTATLRVS
jgi:plastocyanin